MTAGGFPHSEILGSKPCWRLPEAYRSLKRPSSVLSAKASTKRPCKQPTTTNEAMDAARTSSKFLDDKSSHKMITKRSNNISKKKSSSKSIQDGTHPKACPSCSRPLSSSQATTTPTHHDPRNMTGGPRKEGRHGTHPTKEGGGPGAQESAHTTKAKTIVSTPATRTKTGLSGPSGTHCLQNRRLYSP